MGEPASAGRGRSSERLVTGVTPRVKTSVYLDPLVWVPFRDTCKRVGQSTCSVLEALMFGWSRGIQAGGFQDPRPVTVNLKMERVVQRYRRKGHEVEVREIQDVHGNREHCSLCDRRPVARVIFRRSSEVVHEHYLCEFCLEYVDKRGLRRTVVPLYPGP